MRRRRACTFTAQAAQIVLAARHARLTLRETISRLVPVSRREWRGIADRAGLSPRIADAAWLQLQQKAQRVRKLWRASDAVLQRRARGG